MNHTTRYLLDTSVLIEANKTYYAFDLVPTFWKHLLVQSRAGTVSSIDKVKAEVSLRNKELTYWANNSFEQWESTTVESTTNKYQQIMEWAAAQKQYTQSAKDEFAEAKRADAWIIAHAFANKYAIVTEEKFNGDIKKRIPIPNVCKVFDIKYVDTFQMLRDLGINLGTCFGSK